MITGTHVQRVISARITDQEKERIMIFIQGAIYCFCKNCPGQYFSASELFGGVNFNWDNTPLGVLYDWHERNNSSNPIDMAAKDIGWLLLDVVINDSRTFEITKDYTNQYKWISA